MPKLLVLANHRKDRSPGQRFRIEQYLNFLSENGYDIEFSYLLNEQQDKIFYSKSNIIGKAFILLKSYLKRRAEIKKYDQFDLIYIYREAYFMGSTYFEKKIAQSKAKLIFDYDDAIWLQDVSAGNKKWAWLKNPDKTKQIIQYTDLVFAGNQYLADFALKYNNNVQLIPTTIDTEYHLPKYNEETGKVCIGWTGSSTTLKYFEAIIPFLEELKNKFEDKIYFKVIVDVEKEYSEIQTSTTKWSLKDEINQLTDITIGIMPLPKDEWTKGKCGFKGLQYMALEIPTIMSPVGVNSEIIENGVNGFLAESKEEWINALSQLVESEELRKKIGKAARKTVLDRYSVESQKMNYLNEFNKLLTK